MIFYINGTDSWEETEINLMDMFWSLIFFFVWTDKKESVKRKYFYIIKGRHQNSYFWLINLPWKCWICDNLDVNPYIGFKDFLYHFFYYRKLVETFHNVSECKTDFGWWLTLKFSKPGDLWPLILWHRFTLDKLRFPLSNRDRTRPYETFIITILWIKQVTYFLQNFKSISSIYNATHF
jgi:hypothetical protein